MPETPAFQAESVVRRIMSEKHGWERISSRVAASAEFWKGIGGDNLTPPRLDEFPLDRWLRIPTLVVAKGSLRFRRTRWWGWFAPLGAVSKQVPGGGCDGIDVWGRAVFHSP